jgi:hypothetical protein
MQTLDLPLLQAKAPRYLQRQGENRVFTHLPFFRAVNPFWKWNVLGKGKITLLWTFHP